MSDRGLGAEERAELAERAALARALNSEIRNASARFPEKEDVSLEFYCECGCWQTMELTLTTYDSLDGKPVYLSGHPLAE